METELKILKPVYQEPGWVQIKKGGKKSRETIPLSSVPEQKLFNSGFTI